MEDVILTLRPSSMRVYLRKRKKKVPWGFLFIQAVLDSWWIAGLKWPRALFKEVSLSLLNGSHYCAPALFIREDMEWK